VRGVLKCRESVNEKDKKNESPEKAIISMYSYDSRSGCPKT